MSQVFREYRLVEQLARKRSNILYLAEHISDPEKQAVVKVFTAVQFTEEQERAQYLQEISFLGQLNFPHILPILDAGIERIHPYILTRYIPSGSLRDQLSKEPLSLASIIQIVKQVGQSLMYAHGWDIVHANLKPENIFLEDDNHVLLTDFKIPSIFQAVTQTNVPGARIDTRSACYMAPEQFDGITSPETDQYALGCLTYELLTGQPPFVAASLSTLRQKHTHDIPISLRSLRPDLPAYLDKAILQAISKHPDERFTTIADFLRSLELPSSENVIDAVSAGTGPVEVVSPTNLVGENSLGPFDDTLPDSGLQSSPLQGEEMSTTQASDSTLLPATGSDSRKRRPLHMTAVAAIASCLVILLSVVFLPRVLMTNGSLTSSSIAFSNDSTALGRESNSGQPDTTPTLQSRTNRSTKQEGSRSTPTPPPYDTSNSNDPTNSVPTPTPTPVPPTATTKPSPKPTRPKPTPTPTMTPTPTPKPTEIPTLIPIPTEGSLVNPNQFR